MSGTLKESSLSDSPKVLQMKDAPPHMSTTTGKDSTSSPLLQVTAQMKEDVRAEANPPPRHAHCPNPMLV